MSQTVSLPLAHLAPLAAAVAAGADVAATAVLLDAAPDVAAAAVVGVAAPLVALAGALVELELLPHADAVRATAIPTDAT
jgi:selenophosphate synthetase-related protein